MTAGLYKQIGVTDCIVENQQAYVELAVKLATDESLNRQIRDKIINSRRFLFEEIEAVYDIERFFEWSLYNVKQPDANSKYKV